MPKTTRFFRLKENLKIAFYSVLGQRLRTALTILIIALGITALVGILTSIDAIKNTISTEFSAMGANTFNIRNRGLNVRIGRSGSKPKRYPPITYRQAEWFQESFEFPAIVSLSFACTYDGVITYRNQKTNPNVQVIGTDQNYLKTSGYEIEHGRNFTELDVKSGTPLALIGKEINDDLFQGIDALDKEILINGQRFLVIGILKEKGSGVGFGGDKQVIANLSAARQFFENPNESFVINVQVNNGAMLDASIEEATGTFRQARKLQPRNENSFEITRSDSLASILIDSLYLVTFIATLIGLITLLGAAIGLMNIMLVAVNERTREIGTRMAIGATKLDIRSQFLIEAIIICQLGGIAGVVFGIAVGNITSSLVGSAFIIPWNWMILGIVLCFIVGIIAGFYPAQKAANLDPVEALRYE